MHMSPSPANRQTLNISDGGWMPRSWAQEGQVGQAPLGRHHQAISLEGPKQHGSSNALSLMHMSPSPANRQTLNISDGGWMPRSWAQEGQVGQAPLGRHHQVISLEGLKQHGSSNALSLMHMSPSPANRQTLDISDEGWMLGWASILGSA